MDRYRSDILYDSPPWRIGSHVLRYANDCAQRRMATSRDRCRVAAQKLGGQPTGAPSARQLQQLQHAGSGAASADAR